MEHTTGVFTERTKEITDWLHTEYAAVQPGMLTPGMLGRVQVPVYGAVTPLPHCANITAEGSRTVLITPYDVSQVRAVEDALRAQMPSLGVTVSGTGVRATAPAVTGEQRTAFEKILKERAEEAKQSVRAAREKVLADIKKSRADGVLSEDGEFAAKKELQKQVDAVNAGIEQACGNKVRDIQL